MDRPCGADDGDVPAVLSPDMLALLASMGLGAAPDETLQRLPNGDPVRQLAAIQELTATQPGLACGVLARDGVVRLDGCLSAQLCAACAAAVDVQLAVARKAGLDGYGDGAQGFGNVDSPTHRWDMLVDAKPPFDESLRHLLGSGRPLSELFEHLFDGLDAPFHELACLVSDAGAESQRVHPDTVARGAAGCPLYTAFVALTDVDPSMGCTHFIRGSHTEEAHHSLRHGRDAFLSCAEYTRASLRCGDVVVMDSRVFHLGDANESRRRSLFYFTLMNPEFADAPAGSKLPGLSLNLNDYALSRLPPAVALAH